MKAPHIKTALPGPKAKAIVERDHRVTAPAYGRVYPLVVKRAAGMVVEDVDGNLFLDFMAGIAVASTGHSHPLVVKAIEEPGLRSIPRVNSLPAASQFQSKPSRHHASEM